MWIRRKIFGEEHGESVKFMMWLSLVSMLGVMVYQNAVLGSSMFYPLLLTLPFLWAWFLIRALMDLKSVWRWGLLLPVGVSIYLFGSGLRYSFMLMAE